MFCYRVVFNPIACHNAYSIIIAFEVMISVTEWYGGYAKFCSRNASAEQFIHSKYGGAFPLLRGLFSGWRDLLP
ncbi:hypothetical protein DLR11_10795 [Salmonella enterica subsp. salamae]|uniref:DUF2165 domain-containing protein n=1 Tax=Salmonella enterica subsp. salamae TaxID=59202 RepID=A0A5Y3UZQ9_SALER|nr:DUF2165 domain-containing protein [Salmonella enterica subsp. salamae]EDH0692352.1 DUF2165 family protein [Salmonella enterica]ECG8516035.1 DUF2165 domain-containing protein [Salmonella enterica subsp. salamae]ECI3452309.1 hypothetical protein [Salmonella enterica subsp. salamae]ECI4077233.1 hypothetical protein [Salmonella enterica subsp. salamae]